MKNKIKIYADGADLAEIKKYANDGRISGFTTNPTLMRQSEVKNYRDFANELLALVGDKPISFEIFADDEYEIQKQSEIISSWGKNVFVKIPITNTKNISLSQLIGRLNKSGVLINVTAVFTLEQTKKLLSEIGDETTLILSVFAGRIADTGVDPIPLMKKISTECISLGNVETLWASPREILNLRHAEECNIDIITLMPNLLNKMALFGKDLEEFSLETVKMFYNDAEKSQYFL
jgi:transaldolase